MREQAPSLTPMNGSWIVPSPLNIRPQFHFPSNSYCKIQLLHEVGLLTDSAYIPHAPRIIVNNPFRD